MPKPLNILFVASEAVPFAKTGGLGDVAGALPRALAKLGHQVRLVMPYYGWLEGSAYRFTDWLTIDVPMPGGSMRAPVLRGLLPDAPVPVLAVRHDPYFARAGIYGEAADYPDNLDRFAFFGRAAVELLPLLRAEGGWTPDILHGHDWPAALSLVYLRTLNDWDAPNRKIGTLFTIHNIGYQGHFPAAEYAKTGLPQELFTPGGLEFYGKVNLLKGGLLYGDALNTVSPTYAQEIQRPEFGFGLDGVLRERADRLFGVVNGIDVETWNPETDPFLPSRYGASSLAGKQGCKTALQREMRLPVRDVPLLATVSRFGWQKGLDLIADALPTLLKADVQFVLLGTGDAGLEERFRRLHAGHPDTFGLTIGFDEGLAHRIEGGADFFVMPSRYEPCGLSQLYSLRYGTVPIVRRTGGLADTVTPYGAGEPATGFQFTDPTPEALLDAIRSALSVYRDRAAWQRLMTAGMRVDVSWDKSARAYDDLYRTALALRGVPK